MHLKSSCCLVGNIKPFTVTFGSEKHVVVNLCVDRLAEDVFQIDDRFAIRQMSRASVFEPVFRGFDGAEGNVARAALHLHWSGHAPSAAQVAIDIDFALTAKTITYGLEKKRRGV